MLERIEIIEKIVNQLLATDIDEIDPAIDELLEKLWKWESKCIYIARRSN